MPDPDPASPAYNKERRYRFAFKKGAHHVRDDALFGQPPLLHPARKTLADAHCQASTPNIKKH